MNFVFNQPAPLEYSEAVEWYQSRSLFVGPRFIQERFPYKLYYLNEPELITIYAVMHDHRKPDVWRDRLN
jgi:hypothetical protein